MRKQRLRFVLFRLAFLFYCASGPASAVTTLSSFSAGAGVWHMGTIAVGNIDNDAALEIVVPYRDLSGQWHLDAFDWNGTHMTGFPYNSGLEEMNTSPTLYDLDGDGKMEIILMRGASIVALRGNGTVLWQTTVNNLNYIPNAGYQTTTNGFYWSGTGLAIPNLPASAVFSSQFSSPIIADFDGNGTKQIATAWKIDPDPTGSLQDFNPSVNNLFGLGEWGTVGEVWSGGVIFFDAATGAKRFIYHLHQLVEAGLGVGQLDRDKPLEVLVLNDSDSVVAFDKTKAPGFLGVGQLHKMFGKNLRMTSGFYQQAIDIYPADIDGDGLDELLSVTTQFNPLWQPHESLLDDDGALMWRKWKQPVTITNVNGWFNNACMFPVNPDHDNHIDVLGFTHSSEITFRYWDGINFVDHAGWPKSFAPAIPTPPVVGDVDGDGAQEIVIGTYNPAVNPSSGSLYVYALNGTLKQSVAVPGGLKHIPFLADVNGDNSLDVVYRSLAGKIYVQNFGATTATNVSWATHRGNVQRDGNRGTALFPPNTPLIAKKQGGAGKAYLQWNGIALTNADAFKIFRSDSASGPFAAIATVPAGTTNYTDYGLSRGWQYFYEVAAVVAGNEIHSAPVPVLSMANSNLIANGGFEENNNSHWDKWDTGDIVWTNMFGATNAFQGKQAMRIVLKNNATTDTINQFVQYGTPHSYFYVTPGTLYSFGGFIKSSGMNVATKHWFEWTSTISGEFTNARPVMPYPNYFTPELKLGTTANSWTYLNRVFTMPAGFPSAELRHRFSTASPATGNIFIDNVFFRALPAPNNSAWTNLISFHSTWRYLAGSPPSGWYATNFSDSSWSSGTAKFGAGSGPTNVTTVLPGAKATYNFRKKFNVTSTNLEELLLGATCTDDYASIIYPMRLWLNGTEVLSSGIEAVSSDGNAVKYFDLLPFQHLLKTGTNTIAVQLTNTWQADWDNVAFDVNLKSIAAPIVSSGFIHIDRITRLDSRVDVVFSPPVGSNVRLEWSQSANGPWQVVQALTNVTTSPTVISDTGQNGQIPPANKGNRFYRIVRF